jgi:phage/plasmid-associated DNA primase
LVAGNHKPSLTGVDEAIRRRLLLVPFTVQIPHSERDPDLPKKLKAEWRAMLRWMVEGCLQWRRSGLMVPPVVRDASEAYFDEQDTLGQWLEEATVSDANAFARTGDLFASWKMWTEERNFCTGNVKNFSQRLAERGLAKAQHKDTRQMGFRGVRLDDGDHPC